MKKISYKRLSIFLVTLTLTIDIYFITIFGNMYNKYTATSSVLFLLACIYLACVAHLTENENKKI